MSAAAPMSTIVTAHQLHLIMTYTVETLFTAEKISKAVQEIAAKIIKLISRDKTILIMPVVNGGAPFGTDLSRAIASQRGADAALLRSHSVKTHSYTGTVGSKEVEVDLLGLSNFPLEELKAMEIVITDDVLDRGFTAQAVIWAVQELMTAKEQAIADGSSEKEVTSQYTYTFEHGKILNAPSGRRPENIKVAVALDKHDCREEGGLQRADYVGLELGHDSVTRKTPWVGGYGMDLFANYLRESQEILCIKDAVLFRKILSGEVKTAEECEAFQAGLAP